MKKIKEVEAFECGGSLYRTKAEAIREAARKEIYELIHPVASEDDYPNIWNLIDNAEAVVAVLQRVIYEDGE